MKWPDVVMWIQSRHIISRIHVPAKFINFFFPSKAMLIDAACYIKVAD